MQVKIGKYLIIVIIFIGNLFPVFSQELCRYSCLVDRVYIKEFQKANNRKFDKEGILISKKQYHPLAIAQFGVLCYYEFEESGDSIYYFRCLDQTKYFKDSTKINYLFDGKAIGLPYKYKFSDLKAPWYSGMSQGYAISFLLRYYNLTGDKDILPIIEKISYLLKMPQKNGGVLSVNKEGYKFIEEYPNSKRSPQVLNGAINGLIGLKEYCDFFPNDTSALKLFNELYEGLKATIPKYDLADWSCYCIKSKRLSNLYMRYEINEMEQLYNMFGDDYFYNQQMIWSTFVYNKPNKNKIYKRGNFNYSVPVKKYDSIFSIPDIKLDTLIFDSIINEVVDINSKYRIKKYFKNKHKSNKKEKPSSYHILKFNDTIQNGILAEINFQFIPDDFELFCFDRGKIKKINFEILYSTKDTYVFSIMNICSNIIFKTSQKLIFEDYITEFKIIDFNQVHFPFFSHQISKTFKIDEGYIYNFIIQDKNIEKKTIFFKYAKSEPSLKKKIWRSVNSFNKNEIQISGMGYYKFMTVAKLSNPFSMFSEVTLKNKEIVK